METPKLCRKHFFQVASYFDKDVAFEYEIDGDNCKICNKEMFLEDARRMASQKGTSFEPRAYPQAAE